jgi:hypothetical protein
LGLIKFTLPNITPHIFSIPAQKFLLFGRNMDDTQQIEIEYSVTKEVGRQAYSYVYNSKVKPQNFIWLGVILIAVYYFDHRSLSLQSFDGWYFLPLLGIPLGLLITKYYLPRKWGDKMYKQYLGKTIKWVITKQNIHLYIGGGGKTLSWGYFKQAILTNGIILMVTTSDIMTPIPVSAFKEGEFEIFKKWLEENVPA